MGWPAWPGKDFGLDIIRYLSLYKFVSELLTQPMLLAQWLCPFFLEMAILVRFLAPPVFLFPHFFLLKHLNLLLLKHLNLLHKKVK